MPSTTAAPRKLALLQHPQWQALPWLVHGCSTRSGGQTTAYIGDAAANSGGELNLGFTTADQRENVVANRALFLQELLGPGAGTLSQPARLTTLSQIHSANVHVVEGTTSNDATSAPPPGDGMITALPGVSLAILTADCVPVLVVDTKLRVVGAFHAGWRGTAQKIVEAGVAKMRQEFNSRPEDMMALIGPAIGPCCYAVGEELHEEFERQFPYAEELFRRDIRDDGIVLSLDLIEANRRQLLDSGLKAGQIARLGACTSCHPELYFSHRQSRGNTGRMMSVAGIRAET